MNLLKSLRHGAKDSGRFVGRSRTHDVAYKYRMGGGFPGDVNRSHPATIESAKVNSTNPPAAYGLAVLADGTNGVRGMLATDTAVTAIYGIGVRPFPIQSQSGTNYGASPIGSSAPPTTQPIDVLRAGYIIGTLSGTGTPTKGAPVFVWIAASSGAHIQGGFETAATSGSTIALDAKTTFNGPADANGAVEIAFNV